jgi:hypothetical protein
MNNVQCAAITAFPTPQLRAFPQLRASAPILPWLVHALVIAAADQWRSAAINIVPRSFIQFIREIPS